MPLEPHLHVRWPARGPSYDDIEGNALGEPVRYGEGYVSRAERPDGNEPQLSAFPGVLRVALHAGKVRIEKSPSAGIPASDGRRDKPVRNPSRCRREGRGYRSCRRPRRLVSPTVVEQRCECDGDHECEE